MADHPQAVIFFFLYIALPVSCAFLVLFAIFRGVLRRWVSVLGVCVFAYCIGWFVRAIVTLKDLPDGRIVVNCALASNLPVILLGLGTLAGLVVFQWPRRTEFIEASGTHRLYLTAPLATAIATYIVTAWLDYQSGCPH